ncbi:MAG: DUF5916 domain-containing protein [Saprospiraceae bacterium]
MKVSLLLTFFCSLFTLVLIGQPTTKVVPKRIYHTQRIQESAPSIDGELTDMAWEQVAWGNDFRQMRPVDGGKATQETAFKILYDDENLYIGFRCFDTAPDSIVRRMSRRDGFEGDWIEINIDSYHDLRTAFSFTSSVSGVKGDEFITNDGENWDTSWNPIWFLATNIDDEGWTAEVRIPLSQLRYANKEEQIWGIQIQRRNFREEARSIWQRIPVNSGFWVSGFGELHGIKGIRPQKQIELQPYTLGQVSTSEREEGNPFATGSDASVTAGLDGRIGVTGDLTLDFTINPDFGQVEADPSVLVLDGFQVFFREQRPFFVENRNIFDYPVAQTQFGGSFANDNLFYSRRIGGAPHRQIDNDSDQKYYVDQPDNTTILGAAKFSGKTQNGTSIGVLEAITGNEYATISNDGEEEKELVESLTNYFVGRVQQDFREGATRLGGILTAVNRQVEDTPLDFLHRSAYSGSIDFTHQWKNRSYGVTARALFSNVNGSIEAITRTQRSFEHYFQRPDATHLGVDSSATSLTGHGGMVAIGKYGGNWRFEGGLTWRSPELELNDVGFMRNSDEIVHFFTAGYFQNQPVGIFRDWAATYGHSSVWDFSGLNYYQSGNVNLQGTLNNFWGGGGGLFFETKDISNRALFGGPNLQKPTGFAPYFFLFSDSRRPVSFSINTLFARSEAKAVNIENYTIGIRVQPSNAINFSFSPSLSNFNRLFQYVTEESYNGESRYIGAAIDQTTFSLTMRLNYSITPNLTLQYYGQPFISRGRYSDFKYIVDAANTNVVERHIDFSTQQIYFNSEKEVFQIDDNLDSQIDYSFDDPDFNFIQFRSNLVARWEYVPGSEIFLVWSQGVTNFGDPDTEIYPSLQENLFTGKIENIFLAKFTYRFLL